jgi:hypothetical protein
MHSRNRDGNRDLVLPPAPVRWVLARDPKGYATRKPSCAQISMRRQSRFSDGSSNGDRLRRRFRKAARILAPRRNGNGPSHHRTDDAGAVWVVFARYALGGRSQHSQQPSPEIGRVVSETRTFIQRRHRRNSQTPLEQAEYINLPAEPKWCGNSSRTLGKTHRSALLRGLRIREVELSLSQKFMTMLAPMAMALGTDCLPPG